MMLKALRKLKNKPVLVELRDNTIGGGIDAKSPGTVLLFLEMDCLWAAFRWEWNGETVVIPARDILCIGSDLEKA